MAITCEKFNSWKQSFRTKKAYLKTTSFTEKFKRYPVAETLAEARKLKLSVGTPDQLELNLLYACYLATNTVDPDQYESAKERAAYKSQLTKLVPILRKLSDVLTFVKNNRNLSEAALKHSDETPKGRIALSKSKGIDSPIIVEALLTRLEDGFEQMRDGNHPGVLDLLGNYQDGPLLFVNLNNPIMFVSGNKTEAREFGLIFHLIYIFRYFTGLTKALRCEGCLRTQDGELVVSGAMVDSGKPCYSSVAHLVNAAFDYSQEPDYHHKEAYGVSNIKERVNYQLQLPEGIQGKPTLIALSQMQFAGWQLPVCNCCPAPSLSFLAK